MQPPVVQPPVVQPPVVQPPVGTVGFVKLIPWLWSMIIALILLGVGLLLLLVWLLVSRTVRGRQEQKWVPAHVQAVAGVAPATVVEVMESRADGLPPTCVVRIEPHTDSGTQVLEEMYK